MIQKAIFAFCTCLVTSFAIAQTDDIHTILQKVEQNNIELTAFDKYVESEIMGLRSTNVLPNPEAGAYYLPFGNSTAGNYTEVQVSQSFEFPTVYKSRRKLIATQEAQLVLEYEQKRQQVLLQAKTTLIELIAINKLQLVEQGRLAESKVLFEQNQTLYNRGQIAILELNKAKVTYLKRQFLLQQIEASKQGALTILKNLNGGIAIEVTLSDFKNDFRIAAKDSVWQEKLNLSPMIKKNKASENEASQNIKLSRMKSLPDLAVGYNYQGFSNDNVSGVYAGVSIPLWGNKLRNSVAKANFTYTQSNSVVQIQTLSSEFELMIIKHQALLKVYNEYSSSLETLNSEKLLLKAYQTGEISFSEYYVELEFYHNAKDTLLDMEKQLHLIKAQLLNHKL
jgi:outer membrane protein TolC